MPAAAASPASADIASPTHHSATRILGLGTALPEGRLEQPHIAAWAQTLLPPGADVHALLPALYRRTGVRTRHSALLPGENADSPRATEPFAFYPPPSAAQPHGPTTAARMAAFEAHAAPLAVRAAAQALQSAGVAPGAITHLVTASCSGFSAPGFDVALIRALPLPPGTARTHVGFMGCHGALNALRVAHAFTRADPQARVLLVAAELCSLHFHYGADPEQMVANALFADGAAACVLAGESAAGPAGSGGHAALRYLAAASHVVPGTEDAMTWRIGDHGFTMTLAARVPDLIARHLPGFMRQWLAPLGLAPDRIAHWAVHPGGPRILAAVEHALALPPEALAPSRDVLARHGNMSSPTVLLILDQLRGQSRRGPCVALGFGPGLTVEAALLELRAG